MSCILPLGGYSGVMANAAAHRVGFGKFEGTGYALDDAEAEVRLCGLQAGLVTRSRIGVGVDAARVESYGVELAWLDYACTAVRLFWVDEHKGDAIDTLRHAREYARMECAKMIAFCEAFTEAREAMGQ